jgi:hypothetical protein
MNDNLRARVEQELIAQGYTPAMREKALQWLEHWWRGTSSYWKSKGVSDEVFEKNFSDIAVKGALGWVKQWKEGMEK